MIPANVELGKERRSRGESEYACDSLQLNEWRPPSLKKQDTTNEDTLTNRKREDNYILGSWDTSSLIYEMVRNGFRILYAAKKNPSMLCKPAYLIPHTLPDKNLPHTLCVY